MTRAEPDDRAAVNLLPGPVRVAEKVREAFRRDPVSHRAAEFMAEMREIRRRLAELVRATHVEVLLGTGTLANDAIGAQLAARGRRGLVVTTGEFGDRLLDHAERWGLEFAVHEAEWGAPPDYAMLDTVLHEDPEIRWLWAVHCETSTGVVADLARLRDVCARHEVQLCLDVISSVGTMPVDLRGVYLASGASNKGLAAYPGLALVFSDHALEESKRIPRYLDVGTYETHGGVPYTHSSNLVRALSAALDRFETETGVLDPGPAFAAKAAACRALREALEEQGHRILAPENVASPAVLTLVLPRELRSLAAGEALDRQGYHLSYRSRYLVRRNLLQICLMGENSEVDLTRLQEVLAPFAASP